MKQFYLILWIITCIPAFNLSAQNAPITTVETRSTVGTSITLSITASGFNNIGSCNLKLFYDSTIATATAVTKGPLPGGNLSADFSVPGQISLGWYTYPGVTLPGNPLLFAISFTRIATGTSPVNWYDDGFSCVWYDGGFNKLNDLPTPSYYINGALSFLPPIAPLITIPTLSGCTGKTIDIPISVSGFNDVGKFTLTMLYGTQSITWQSFTGIAGFPGLVIDGSTPGTLIASGQVPAGSQGITLPDGAVIFTLHFIFSGGSTGLTWSDNGPSCAFFGQPPGYIDLSDLPSQAHYTDGSVSELSLPAAAGAIEGPVKGHVYRGQTGVNLKISKVPGAAGYNWALPPGLTLSIGENTESITVSVSDTFRTGSVSVSGYNMCGIGAVSPEFLLTDTISIGIPVSGHGTSGEPPRLLLKSFPNPFSGTVTLGYFLPLKGQVSLEVISMHGEKILMTAGQFEQAGDHSIRLSFVDLKPGLYLARIVLNINGRLLSDAVKIVCNE